MLHGDDEHQAGYRQGEMSTCEHTEESRMNIKLTKGRKIIKTSAGAEV